TTSGPLGYPLSDEQSYTDGDETGLMNMMEGGWLVYDPSITPASPDNSTFPVLSYTGSWGNISASIVSRDSSSVWVVVKVHGRTPGESLILHQNNFGYDEGVGYPSVFIEDYKNADSSGNATFA